MRSELQASRTVAPRTVVSRMAVARLADMVVAPAVSGNAGSLSPRPASRSQASGDTHADTQQEQARSNTNARATCHAGALTCRRTVRRARSRRLAAGWLDPARHQAAQ